MTREEETERSGVSDKILLLVVVSDEIHRLLLSEFDEEKTRSISFSSRENCF